MKKIMIAVFTLTTAVLAFGQRLAMNTTPMRSLNPGNAIFSWTTTKFDFGQIKAGIPVAYEFTFTNSGEVPLVISTVQASCGCTVTSYTKEPIGPGAKGFVKATYNAANVGQFTKSITVNANTEEGVARLVIKGEVVKDEVVQ